MRRALPTIALTAAGLTWLLRAQGAIDDRHAPQAASNDAAAPATTTTTTPPPFGDPRQGRGDDGDRFFGDDGGGFAGPSSTTTTTPTPPGGKVVDGPVVETRWGPVQVAAVITANRLVDVRVLEYPNEARRSEFINEQALPILHQEAISAQSANLDAVSGATYTYDGYTQSLQAALDAAGFRH